MEKLKLKASSGSELDMISALAQNGLVLKSSIEFKDNVFYFLLNRFCWELSVDKKEDKSYRIHSAIYFQNVKNVAYNFEFQNHNKDEFLSLMTIHSDFANQINIVFANNAIISLTISSVEVFLKDLHDHWVTESVPNHDI